MTEWILSNKEWLFSGAGLALITIVCGLFLKKRGSKKLIIKADKRSVAAKTISHSTITTGDTKGD